MKHLHAVVALTICLCLAGVGQADLVAVDASDSWTVGNNGGSITESFTVDDNADRLLVAFAMNRGSDGWPAISELSYGGADFIELSDANALSPSGYPTRIQPFYLPTPASGDNDLVYTVDKGNRGNLLIVFSLYNAAQTAPALLGTDSLTGNASSITGTPGTDTSMLISALAVEDIANLDGNESDVQPSDGVSMLEALIGGTSGQYTVVGAAGTKAVTGGSETTVGWTWDSNDDACHVALEIVPEPTSLALLALGGLAALRRRR